MSLNFVTGKRGAAHISSADWRSLNRGIVGEGKFYLEDTESNSNGDFLVNASEGKITVPPRSFIWSGAHIRNDSLYVVNYVPPTSTSTINLWFHYIKDIDTGNESIDFVTTIGSQPSPIADVIDDTTLEAYTAVYSFVHNAEQLVSEKGTEHFKNIDSLGALKTSVIQLEQEIIDESSARETDISKVENSLSILEEEIKDDISDLETATNGKIANLERVTNAINNELPNLKLKSKYLRQDYNAVGGHVYSSSEPLSNFVFFVFLRKAENSRGKIPMFTPALPGTYSYIDVYSKDVALTEANETITAEASFTIYRETNGTFSVRFSNHSGSDYNDLLTDIIGYYY